MQGKKVYGDGMHKNQSTLSIKMDHATTQNKVNAERDQTMKYKSMSSGQGLMATTAQLDFG
jgi:hypothetical protein